MSDFDLSTIEARTINPWGMVVEFQSRLLAA